MCENQTEKSFVIPDNIMPYFNTAQYVYAFMTGVLTDLQSRYIFKKILKDAYEIATMYPTNEAVGFLLEIINNLPNCIKTEDKNRLIESLNFQGVQICVKTGNEIQFTHKSLTQSQQQLPPIEHLVQEFKLFDKNVYKDEFYYPNLELWERLSRHIKDDDISAFLKQPVPDLERNCFYLMEFMIGFQKWNNEYVNVENEDELTDNDKLYFRWYCLGEIMDVILDIIYTTPQLEISKSLYASLLNACKTTPQLNKVIKDRYVQLSKLRLLPENFICVNENKEIKKPKQQNECLGFIRDDDKTERIEDSKITNLFSLLVKKGHLRADDEYLFKSIVSEDYISESVTWLTKVEFLTAFLYVAYYNVEITNDLKKEGIIELVRKANKLFVAPEGEEIPVNTIKKSAKKISQAIIEMKKIFRAAGIPKE